MDAEIVKLLKQARTIAVVGISEKPDRPSNDVASYLIEQGYDVIPVNPALEQVFGRRCFKDIASIGKPVDIVDVFRRPEAVPESADEAIASGARAIWMQEGVSHDEAAKRARAAGLIVIEDLCIKKVLMSLGGRPA